MIMETLWQDLRFALRTLRKNLSVTLLATGSLALAIAGNTTVYSLVNGLLYRPLPYEDVERLEMVGERNSDLQAGRLNPTSAANYLDFAERQSSFERMAAFRGGSFNLDAGSARPEQVSTGEVTPGFFSLLGVEPVWGRGFLPQEGTRGSGRVAVLSHELWAERFPGRRDLGGETLDLNGELYEIVGVLPEGFDWVVAPDTRIWVPLALERGAAPRDRRDLFVLGRLAEGVTPRSAQADLQAIEARLSEEYPETNRGYTVELINLREDIPDPRSKLFIRLIQVALIFVLLIACANIANLLLARSRAREREIAVRTAVGASRRRIVVQLFTESLVMALLAGAVGTALGYVGMELINRALAGFLPQLWLPSFDLRVLGYSFAVTVLGGVLFGIAPVVQTSRLDLLPALKDGTRGATAGSRRRLASNGLVVLEIAFALAFLAGASMMIRTFQTMQSADPGFATDHLLIAQLDLPEERYDTPEKRVTAAGQVEQRLAGLPGVRSVLVSNLFPRMGFVPQGPFEIEGRPPAGDEALPKAGMISVGPEYFEALGIPLERGRTFAASDTREAPRVAVINQAMAQRFWKQDNPLGRRLLLQGEPHEIVGVVGDVRHGAIIVSEVTPLVYLVWAQQPSRSLRLSLLTDVEPKTLSQPVRRELTAFDPTAVLARVETLDDFVDQFWVGQRVFITILRGFGLLALVLAVIGTYGVLAYSVSQRSHEIGIRMAIGAGRGSVMRMIARQGLILGAAGVALAVPLIWAQVKLIGAVFAGTVPVEAMAVAGVALLLLVVTLAASLIPARRAAGIDPLEALRSE
jgi:putative ABC transport system permease protein